MHHFCVISSAEVQMANDKDQIVAYASMVREMIRHEDNLYDKRMTWFCTIQGLLWAALAISWQLNGPWILACILSVVGVLVSASSYLAFRASLRAIDAQREWWDSNKPSDYKGPDVIGRRPDDSSIPWMRPHVVFPVGLAVAWTLAGVVRVLEAFGLSWP
jgi:hypothetical protein